MKKYIILICSLALVLGMVGAAGALTFTDTQLLFRTYSGTGSDSWYHNTPDGLNVPPDTVNSATLCILAWLVDGSNDYIEVEGVGSATLNNGTWFFGLSWTGIDIGDTFATWIAKDDTINDLKVTLNYDEQGWCGKNFMTIKTSTLKLDYEKGSIPVPEPQTMLMLGSILLGLVAVTRKRFNDRS